jgi:hypothetical protein
MRRSLERPVVRNYLMEQKQVFRSCLSAKTLSHLVEIAAQRSNMNAAVNACRAIDGDEAANVRPSDVQPGIVIRIINMMQPPAEVGTVIDATPTKPELAPAIKSSDPIFRPPGY